MKTIGTLEEIGAQVGDVVEYMEFGGGGNRVMASDKPNAQGWWMAEDKDAMSQDKPYWRIVTRAAKSPVRTVTRKEVVPGVYGHIWVDRAGDDSVCVGFLNNALKKMETVGLSRADQTAALDRLIAEAVRPYVALLTRWQGLGCPNCNGDCSHANPPIYSCIMQETSKAILAASKKGGA